MIGAMQALISCCSGTRLKIPRTSNPLVYLKYHDGVSYGVFHDSFKLFAWPVSRASSLSRLNIKLVSGIVMRVLREENPGMPWVPFFLWRMSIVLAVGGASLAYCLLIGVEPMVGNIWEIAKVFTVLTAPMDFDPFMIKPSLWSRFIHPGTRINWMTAQAESFSVSLVSRSFEDNSLIISYN